jgi:hypothetical protein
MLHPIKQRLKILLDLIAPSFVNNKLFTLLVWAPLGFHSQGYLVGVLGDDTPA